MRKLLFSAILLMASVAGMHAATVKVTMNTVSTTMTLADKATATPVAVGTPSNKVYTFTVDNGTYVLTGYDTDGKTVNGSIELVVEGDSEFTIQTATLGFSNTGFLPGTDLTLELNLKDAKGNAYETVIGDSKTAGRKTFLVFKGSKTSIVATPTAARAAEGYIEWKDTENRTHNSNATIWVALPQHKDFTITLPATAYAQLATKTNDYVAFTEIAPDSVVTSGATKVYHYGMDLKSSSTTLMYRIWGEGFCTQAGTISQVLGMEDLVYTEETLKALSPKYINHDIKANSNLNVADVFVNINPQGHLKMQVGDTKDVLALRTWQLTNNSTANMYVDPDYHYTVFNLKGEEDNSVVKFDRYTTYTDPWVTLSAVGTGTAVVLVTYDAMQASQIDKDKVSPYMGGEAGKPADWSAIWPENTGVFVVTVGDEPSGIKTNMWANTGMNDYTHKLATDSLDAEHDVIYYLAEDSAAQYTFKPEGVAQVYISYPTFGTNSATYKEYKEVKANEDGSYTLTLKEGRQIVAMFNAKGVAEYQVITAKPCTREISNLTRPGEAFRAGDKVAIQYHGLFHPNNKLSRIYNMTAYVAYNGVPAGTSEYGSAGQYTFAAVESAQLYKYIIPLDAAGKTDITDGTIQINGFGDPIGNHRNISRIDGRVFSGAAPSHKTYLGILPDVSIEVEGLKHHTVVFSGLPEGAKTYVMNDAQDTLEADVNGNYDVIYGAFTYSVEAASYAPLHSAFTVSMSQNDTVVVKPVMTVAAIAWDGTTVTEPTMVDNVYQIATPAELAWLAQAADTATAALNAVLTADLNLGGHNWTSIGTSAKPYLGTFDGQNHTISGFYMAATKTYQSLFGKLKEGTIKNLTVHGYVTSTTTHAAGIVGGVEAGRLENLHFHGTVNTNKNNTAGIAGYVYGANAAVVGATIEGYIFGASNTGGIAGTVNVATDTVRNCYNWAFVSGTGLVGGIAGTCNGSTTIKNVYNAGALQMRSVTNTWGSVTTATTIGAVCGLASYGKLENGYAALGYNNENNAANKTVVLGQDAMCDGTLAHITGLGQQIGVDPYPVAGSAHKLFAVTYIEQGRDTAVYYTEAMTLGEKWFDNVLGWYHNAEGDTVRSISSDTVLHASVALKPLTGAATFEERTLKPETAWTHDPDFTAGPENTWTSGDYTFNTIISDYGMWYFSAFSMSNITSTQAFSWMLPDATYYSAAGGAAEGNNYAIWNMGYGGADYVTLAKPQTVSGMAVTNNTYVIDAIRNGDGQSVEEDGSTGKPFGEGDYLLLTIEGYKGEVKAEQAVNFYLADFRDSNTTYDWTYVEKWQWVDLSKLGEVDKLTFSLSSTKANAWGMSTPAYFCLDNLGGKQEDCRLGELTHITGTKTPTGLDGGNGTMQVEKLMQNGVLYIIRNGHVYNAQGQLLK